MSNQNNAERSTAQELYQRLMYELYVNGPFRLVEETGHADLVNEKVRLCCSRERYLDVITAMEEQALLTVDRNDERECIFKLTYKGYMTALVLFLRYRKRCDCSRCAASMFEAIEKVLVALQRCGPLELAMSAHRNHPHLVGNDFQLCCGDGSFLDAIAELERHQLVELIDGFKYQLTSKGRITADVLQVPDLDKKRSRATLN